MMNELTALQCWPQSVKVVLLEVFAKKQHKFIHWWFQWTRLVTFLLDYVTSINGDMKEISSIYSK
jgi:hypothetical protein